MKKLLFILLCALTATLLHAQNAPTALVLWHTDGSLSRILLSENPKITFANDMISVKGETSSLEFPIKNVPHFYYDNSSSISSVDAAKTSIRILRDAVVFEGEITQENVRLFSIDGKSQPVNYTKTSTGLSVDITSLNSGAYIININGNTAKFIKL